MTFVWGREGQIKRVKALDCKGVYMDVKDRSNEFKALDCKGVYMDVKDRSNELKH